MQRVDSHEHVDTALYPAPLGIRRHTPTTPCVQYTNGAGSAIQPRPVGSNANRHFKIIAGTLYGPCSLPDGHESMIDESVETQRTHVGIFPLDFASASQCAPSVLHSPVPHAHPGLQSSSTHAVPTSHTAPDHDLTCVDPCRDETADTTAESIPLRTPAEKAHVNRYGHLPHGASAAEPFDATTYVPPEDRIPMSDRPFRRPGSIPNSLWSLNFIERDQLDDNVAPNLLRHVERTGHHIVDTLLRKMQEVCHTSVLHRSRSSKLIAARDSDKVL
jgi:hypothetical protein